VGTTSSAQKVVRDAREHDVPRLAELSAGSVKALAPSAGVDTAGHVASLYVRADRARQGIGRTLLDVALDRARALGVHAFHAEASELTLPVFQQFGLVVRGIEQGACGGAEFERYFVSTVS